MKFQNASFSHAVALRGSLVRKLQVAIEESIEADKAKEGLSSLARQLRDQAVVLGEQIAEIDEIIESLKGSSL